MTASPESYHWLSESSLEVAGCVTVVADGEAAGVRSAFGADGDPSRGGFEEAVLGTDPSWAWFTRSGTAQVVIEDNGFQGSRAEILGPASRASSTGKAASVFWNVNGVVIFSCARRGKVLASAELIGLADEDLAGVPKAVRRLAALAESDATNLVGLGAAMVEAYTGIGFGPGVLSEGHRYKLTPPADELMDFYPPSYSLDEADVEFVPAIIDADPAMQRRLATFAAVAAAREAGLEALDPVRELLANLERGSRQLPPSLTALYESLRRQGHAAEFRQMEADADGEPYSTLASGYLWQKINALVVMRQATHAQALSAAVTSLERLLTCARGSVLRRGDIFREDDSGRQCVGSEDLTLHRRQTIVGAARKLLAGELGVGAAIDALPAPLTDEQREQALRVEAEQMERGEFRTYQIWREPGSG